MSGGSMDTGRDTNSTDPRSVVDQLISRVATDRGLLNHRHYVTQKFDKGENYVGEIQRVTIEGLGTDGQTQQINVIVKKAPPGINQNLVPVHKYYGCEDFAYNKYFPALYKIQDNAGIADDSKIRFAKCYASSLELEKEVFVFEDLNAAGYKLTDRFKSLDKDHARIVIKTQAKYHALAYAFKQKSTKEEYESYRHISAIKEEYSNNYFSYIMNIGNKFTDHVDEECRGAFENFTTSEIHKPVYDWMDLDKTPEQAPYNIILHGDSWNNNFLFKYDDKNKVTDMVLIDWQMIRIASPVCDIIYTLFICLDEMTREEIYDELVDLYYVSLKQHLEQLGCDPEECYPESVYREHLEDKIGYALVTAILYLPFTLVNKEDSLSLNDLLDDSKTEMDASDIKFSKECIERMNGVIRYVHKKNVIYEDDFS